MSTEAAATATAGEPSSGGDGDAAPAPASGKGEGVPRLWIKRGPGDLDSFLGWGGGSVASPRSRPVATNSVSGKSWSLSVTACRAINLKDIKRVPRLDLSPKQDVGAHVAEKILNRAPAALVLTQSGGHGRGSAGDSLRTCLSVRTGRPFPFCLGFEGV